MALVLKTFEEQMKISSYNLAKESIEIFIKSLYKYPNQYSQNEIIDLYAQKFSDLFSQNISKIIDIYIKTSTVIVNPGQVVTGTAVAGVVAAVTTTNGVGTIK